MSETAVRCCPSPLRACTGASRRGSEAGKATAQRCVPSLGGRGGEGQRGLLRDCPSSSRGVPCRGDPHLSPWGTHRPWAVAPLPAAPPPALLGICPQWRLAARAGGRPLWPSSSAQIIRTQQDVGGNQVLRQDSVHLRVRVAPRGGGWVVALLGVRECRDSCSFTATDPLS